MLHRCIAIYTPYWDARDYKTIATVLRTIVIHPAKKTDIVPASHNALSGYIARYTHSSVAYPTGW